MKLSDKHSIPCEGNTAPLPNSTEDELLRQVTGWEIDRLFEHKIKKTFTLKSFPSAIDFVNKVAAIAEHEGHHPELHVNFKKVRVDLYTHAILGLSNNDFIVAAKINEVAGETYHELPNDRL